MSSSLAEGFVEQISFRPHGNATRLPFYFRRIGKRILISNDSGEYYFLEEGEFQLFLRDLPQLPPQTWNDLFSRGFLAPTDSLDLSLQLLATRLRTRFSRLSDFAALHLFVVTLRCDHSCHYCQVSRVSEDKLSFDMSPSTAMKAVALMFQSPSRHLKVEFQGGEPLLNFSLIKTIVEECEKRNVGEERDISYVVTTNLANLTEEHLSFFKEKQFNISTSLDGPRDLHDSNRSRKGESSYSLFRRNLDLARSHLGTNAVAALMTTSSRSHGMPREIVQEYVRLGFEYVFIRPQSPYGFARKGKMRAENAQSMYKEFYSAALAEVIAANRGQSRIVEGWAQILLQRMIGKRLGGFVDLMSPSGAGIMALLFNYDGRVYPADEGRMLQEMGDHGLSMGSVDSTYEQLYHSDGFKAIMRGGVSQALPECSTCAFQPFCGADPVYHYAMTHDTVGFRPTSDFCDRMKFSFDLLLRLLESEDLFVRSLLHSWGSVA